MSCLPIPYLSAVPDTCAVPEGISICLNPEACIDIIDAGCIAYNGYALPKIGVLPTDRLDDILIKLNTNSPTVAVHSQASSSVTLSGSGLATDPLIASAIIDSTPGLQNILTVSAAGLKVELTPAVVLSLLQVIEATPSLQAMFCELVSKCTFASCGIPSNISASMN